LMADQQWFGGQALHADITVKGLPDDSMDLQMPRQVGLYSESFVAHAAPMSRLLHVSSGTENMNKWVKIKADEGLNTF